MVWIPTSLKAREEWGAHSRGVFDGDRRNISFAYQEAVMYEVVLKRFERPDEVRTFEKGKFELVQVGGMTIGRATYQPGWKWSLHVGKAAGAKSCLVEHVGLVVSGRATAAMDDGRVIEMKAGDVFYIAPGHDSWVVGDEPYVSLHFMGASDYARQKK
jgi:quercetin dioxygenase-like cupin family protein